MVQHFVPIRFKSFIVKPENYILLITPYNKVLLNERKLTQVKLHGHEHAFVKIGCYQLRENQLVS